MALAAASAATSFEIQSFGCDPHYTECDHTPQNLGTWKAHLADKQLLLLLRHLLLRYLLLLLLLRQHLLLHQLLRHLLLLLHLLLRHLLLRHLLLRHLLLLLLRLLYLLLHLRLHYLRLHWRHLLLHLLNWESWPNATFAVQMSPKTPES